MSALHLARKTREISKSRKKIKLRSQDIYILTHQRRKKPSDQQSSIGPIGAALNYITRCVDVAYRLHPLATSAVWPLPSDGPEMALMILNSFAVLCALLTFSAAAKNKIREHPHSVLVAEGTWANFTCGIKLPGHIEWRIGNFSDDGNEYNTAERLPDVQGVTAERSFPPTRTGRILTETIGILASEELDGTPVECMFVSHIPSRNSYSKIAVLNVQLQTASAEKCC